MKKLKRFCLLLAGVICLLLGGNVAVARAEAQSSGMDVILVLDLSGSMRSTDPNRVSLEGAKMFIDMMETSGSRAGFVGFSGAVVQAYDLTEINSTDDKTNLKTAIDTLQYDGDTNIGAAVQQALSMLEQASDVGNKKMILLFTDGKIDMPHGSPSEEEAEAASLEQANAVVSQAAADGIAMYTIGLNANGKVDTDLITNMAASTGGTNNIVASASELPTIFNDIFADFVESSISDLGVITITDSSVFQEKVFNIPNGSVLEANIVMITGGTGSVTELEVVDPAGAVNTPNGSNIIFSASSNYNILKMIGPAVGDWTLRIKGNQGCEIHVNLLFNYDVLLAATIAEDPSGGVLVTANLMQNNVPISDSVLYSQMTTTVNVVRTDGTITSYPMTLQDLNFVCTVPVSAGESVSITAHTEGANMYRDSETLQYTAPAPTEIPEPTQAPVELTATGTLPSPFTIKGFLPSMAEDSLKLSDYWALSDPQAGTVSYQAWIDDGSVADVSINGDELVVKGKKKGTATVTVQAADTLGNTASQTMTVEVKPILSSIIPIIIAAAVVVVLILLLVLKKLLTPPTLSGFLHYSVSEDGGSYGREEDYSLEVSGKSENLGNIVVDTDIMLDLGKLVLTGNKNGVLLTNKSKSCELKDQFGAAKKSIVLSDGGSCTVECVGDDGSSAEIAIRYTVEEEY